ncbi:hypothetical protein ACFXG4_23460 [Nocardia sp. NPDC059246]|uniref:hypothetical protein n=1 Tax=unclassified Nocardia TaxID=2637762 RepID=UPI0036B851D2
MIEDLPHNRASDVKYTVRAGEKNPDTLVEDLGKSLWFKLRELYRLGVTTFNPAAPDAENQLRMFLGWGDATKAKSPMEKAYEEIQIGFQGAQWEVTPKTQPTPRVWERFADIPRGVFRVTDAGGDIWLVSEPPHRDEWGPYTEVLD